MNLKNNLNLISHWIPKLLLPKEVKKILNKESPLSNQDKIREQTIQIKLKITIKEKMN